MSDVKARLNYATFVRCVVSKNTWNDGFALLWELLAKLDLIPLMAFQGSWQHGCIKKWVSKVQNISTCVIFKDLLAISAKKKRKGGVA